VLDTGITVQLLLQVAVGILFYTAACRIANITELKTVYGLIKPLLSIKKR